MNLNNLKKNKVSIIMPNYNSHKFISKTLKSIVSQTYKNWELIIVDDFSDDKTIKILKKIKNKKIKIFFQKKKIGAADCRNLAIEKSTGEYLAFIDSDDIWLKNKIKNQLIFMIQNNYNFTYTNYYSFKESTKSLKKIFTPKTFNFDSFIKNTSIATSTMIIKKTISHGCKFPKTLICEDYFFKCQLLKKVKIAYGLNEFLTKYQIRVNSLQSNKYKNLYWIWRINKQFNKLNIFKNIISILFISLNSLKKYGFK